MRLIFAKPTLGARLSALLSRLGSVLVELACPVVPVRRLVYLRCYRRGMAKGACPDRRERFGQPR